MIFNTMVRGENIGYPKTGYHNSICRGNNLGDHVTEGQWAEIAAGTFGDMYIGDYWQITASDGTADRTVKWVICAFDYYMNVGSPRITDHHLVMMPRELLSLGGITYINTENAGVTVYSQESANQFKWHATMAAPNSSKTYDVKYTDSRIRNVVLPVADILVKNAFGQSHCLAVQEYLPTTMDSTTGLATAANWTSDARICDLCNENMVFGSLVKGNSVFEVGASSTQLPIFAYSRPFMNIYSSWWLRNVSSPTNPSVVYYRGAPLSLGSANIAGVRPRFCIY